MRRFVVLLALASPTAVMAAQPDDAYTLGELQVTARTRGGELIGGSVIGSEDLRRFDKVSLDRALDLAPGVIAGNSGGSRNERLIFVRGFDRFQTTLSIDGVRVFLPADNRIDFGRFQTADLSQIQISKGYVSVLDGPGGLGGAINLVTRKPTQALDGELRAGVNLDGDGGYNAYTLSGRIGTRQDLYYLQVSGAKYDRDHFSLSDDFKSTVLEDGGERARSNSEDWRVNVKAGLTPNETDEYSVNFTRQEGSKNAPYHVTDTASTRYWSWPYWNIDSLSFLSTTKIADSATLKTRVYRNTFENGLFSYDSAAQTTQTLGRAFRSYYDDEAYGGNVELGVNLTTSNTLKVAAYYRKDRHVEWQQTFSPALIEPRQTTTETTGSLAIEDTHSFGQTLDVVLGVSYDWRDLNRAEDFNAGQFVYYPLTDDDSWNWQAAARWQVSDAASLHASVSSRTRFPTLFERFSSRFGTAIPNPNVKPERATSFELGGQVQVSRVNLSGAVFYSDIEDALIQVPVALGPPFGTVNQTRNAGDGEYYGAELELKADVTDTIQLGGNYTYIHRELTDPTNAAFKPQGVPDHKLFAYVDWRVTDAVRITPTIEAASNRWTVTSSSAINPPRFYKTGDYVLTNLSVQWTVTPKIDLVVGGRNLFDENYQLVDGFPEEGRSFFADLRMRL
ncbi:TonB-dependent receptor [Phenylobacterium sp.]|uniref:TonB-dependent receptor plug domain-containing protein n=1 Tax=Phenylobacterium sp. TaxID=1871053 RepID=UPI0025E81874|nr:TonB-dependent receptor [Phenylobacterium sp.]